MSLTLLKHEIRNHLSYVIQWDTVDPRSFTHIDSDDTNDPCELWTKCIQYLDRELNPEGPPPPPKKEQIPHLRGPSHRISLTLGDHRKLTQYFRKFALTVDQSDSDSGHSDAPITDNHNPHVNIRKIPSTVLLWRACETQDGLIARPLEQKSHRNNTRDASHILFRVSNDTSDITGQNPAQDTTFFYHFGQLLRLVLVRFAGHTHALAFIKEFKTESQDPGLHKRCTPHAQGTKTTIVPVSDIMELSGVLQKQDGSHYFCTNGTAIHHFNYSSDSEG